LTFYSNYVSISCRELLNVENIATLKNRSRLLKVLPFSRLGMVSCYCSIVTLSWDIRLQICRDLENRVTVH